jgi:hypothetical protein
MPWLTEGDSTAKKQRSERKQKGALPFFGSTHL